MVGEQGEHFVVAPGLDEPEAAHDLLGLGEGAVGDGHLSPLTAKDAPFAVAMVDVDHFKQFNDRYGHATGDRALRYVARVLQRAVRRSDLVARYGGEEFVVVLRETGAAEALERVQEIRRAVEAEPLVVARGTGPANVTVSIGVASWPADGRVTTGLLRLSPKTSRPGSGDATSSTSAGKQGGSPDRVFGAAALPR